MVSKRICLRLLIFVCAFFVTGCGTSEKKDEQKAEVNAEIIESDNYDADISDFERRMDEKSWDYQYLKSDATVTVATLSDVDEKLAQEIIDSHVYEYVSTMGITFFITESGEYKTIAGSGVAEETPSQLQKDFENRMNEKGWDYQYLKSDATITVATMDDIDKELAQEIIESHVYEYVSSVGIAFRVTDCDEYVYVEGIKN